MALLYVKMARCKQAALSAGEHPGNWRIVSKSRSSFAPKTIVALKKKEYYGSMGKSKTSATGKGYLGEVMVHRISREVGVVENVVEAKAGWPPEITIKQKNGSLKKGKLSDFKQASAEQKKYFANTVFE
jgi:hypothetical protein